MMARDGKLFQAVESPVSHDGGSYGKTLAASAQRFEDSNKLSAGVSGNPEGIGFIGLNYIGANKLIALSDSGVT